MTIPTRLKPENENQKHCRVKWRGMFGNMILETFLTQAEMDDCNQNGFLCETL